MGFLFFAPQLGQLLAVFAISAPQTEQGFVLLFIIPPKRRNIPNWDIKNIPERDNTVKVIVLRLRELRKEKNITQLKLAMELNMSQNSISRYEKGDREPGLAELIRIADYFDVSVDFLLERTNNRKINR